MDKPTGKRLNQYIKDYVVFDLETTGLSPKSDEIIELSAIKVRNHQAAEEFSTLVNPGRPIPFSASRINGITDDLVKDAPLLETALKSFMDFIAADTLVGHNIHAFDMPFLCSGSLRTLNRTVPNDYIDTLYLSRNCLPHLARHRLTDLAEHFRISTKGAHRALNDCAMNQLCYEKLRELWESQPQGESPASPCPQCGSMLIRKKGRFGEFLGCSAFPQCRYTRNA